jgi:hypothetical protein
MNTRRPKISMSDQAKQALDDLGAEPLVGSGFEDEAPDPEFSDSPAAAPGPEAHA